MREATDIELLADQGFPAQPSRPLCDWLSGLSVDQALAVWLAVWSVGGSGSRFWAPRGYPASNLCWRKYNLFLKGIHLGPGSIRVKWKLREGKYYRGAILPRASGTFRCFSNRVEGKWRQMTQLCWREWVYEVTITRLKYISIVRIACEVHNWRTRAEHNIEKYDI